MKTSRIGKILMSMLVVLAVSSVVARAESVEGTNATLDAQGGTLYIPFDQTGTLNGVGTSSDSVTLSTGQSATGWVEFELVFDVSPVLTPQKPWVDFDSPADLLFAFEDLDFQAVISTVSGLTLSYRESMDLVLLDSPGGSAVGTPLTIDSGNYMTYKDDANPVTNNVPATYTVGLRSDLGVLNFNFINDDEQFALLIRLHSYHDYVSGSGTRTRTNTAEDFGADFAFSTVVPEPATLGFLSLGLGATVLLRRKRS